MTCKIQPTSRYRQAGAFTILSAFTLLMLLMCLVLVLDSGRLYLEQRKLQKVADTSALGTLLLLPDGNCSTDRDETLRHATANAAANDFTRTLDLQCADIEHVDGLRVAVTNNTSGRAVEVTVSDEVPSSLIMQVGSVFNSNIANEVVLQATAVAARDEPVAVFSVEAQLLNLDEDGLLTKLLAGIGLNPETIKLLTSDGLATVDITPSGLLKELGVKAGVDLKTLTPNGLVETLGAEANLLTLPKILDASIKLIEESAVSVGVNLVEAIDLPTELKELKVHLFSTYDEANDKTIPGIISVDTNGPLGAALDARVNLGDILRTAILVGAQGRGISIGALSPEGVPTESLDLLGLVEIQAGIIEPPSIGIGPVGTTAHNAQIRLLIEADTNDTLLIGGLLDALGTRVHLPVIIEVTNTTATLDKLTCDGPHPVAEITTTGSIADICIGEMPEGTMWSTSESCLEKAEDTTLASALGISLIRGSVAVPVLENPTSDDLSFDLTDLPSTQFGSTNDLPLGTTVKAIIDELLELTLVSQDIPNKITQDMAEKIATSYLSAVSPHNSRYTKQQLNQIKDKLSADKFDWKNPGLVLDLGIIKLSLGEQLMPDRWLKLAYEKCNNYAEQCVYDELVTSLQSKATSSPLDLCIFGTCVSNITAPLIRVVLDPILSLLGSVLDFVGEHVLTPILNDLLGIEIGQPKVTVHDASCGAPRLVL